MASSLIPYPAPDQLPAPVAEAYEAAMHEVVTLMRSPQVQRRFAAVLLSELRTQRALQQCTPQSIILSIVEMAQYGLDPAAPNECFLIPYTVYEHGRVVRTDAQLQLGYGGLIKLACAHPDVHDVWAEAVHTEDTYQYRGLVMRPEHVYPPAFADRGPVLGFYAVALLSGDRERCVQMSVAEMKNHARRFSRNHDKKVWSDGPGGGFMGMSLKTMLRKICNPKLIPMAGRVAELVMREDDAIEGTVLTETAVLSRAYEQTKTLDQHLEDLGYEPPAADGPVTDPPPPPAPAPPSTAAAAPPEPAPEPPVEPPAPPVAPTAGVDGRLADADPATTRDVRIAIDSLLDAHGFSPQQRTQWRARQCKRFRMREFARMPADLLDSLLEELRQLPLPEPGEPAPVAPADTDDWRINLTSVADRTAELLEGLEDGPERTDLLELCTQARHAAQQGTTTPAQAESLCTQLYQASDQAAKTLGLGL